MPDAPLSRREFVKTTALAAAPALAGFPAILGARDANQQLQVGFIGVGGRGSSLLAAVSSAAAIRLSGSSGSWNGCGGSLPRMWLPVKTAPVR